MKRPTICRFLLIASIAVLSFAITVFGQEANQTETGPVRRIKGRTIYSQELPKAELTIARGFRFVGTQRVNLYGNSEAEQYLFVKVGAHKTADKFYWIQFEHFLPTNNRTYNYAPKRTTHFGVAHGVADGDVLEFAAILHGALLGRCYWLRL